MRKSGNATQIILVLSFVALVLIIAIVVLANQSPQPDEDVIVLGQDNDFDGSTIISPARIMPDFSLTNQDGGETSLRELQGKPTLIFFGYIHCPDVCPLTMNQFKRVQQLLGDVGNQVNYVFISVDGTRDNPEDVRQFLEVRGGTDFIGLTGNEDEIRRIGIDYELFFEVVEDTYVDEDVYYVDHTSNSFLLDADGKWILKYAFGTEPEVIAEDLKTMVG